MNEKKGEISRQIWLPQSVVANVQTQKVNDARSPRKKPTLKNAFISMFKAGLEKYESQSVSWNIEPRDVSDSGYYVLQFDSDSYTRAEQIASTEGVTILDVIVSLIRLGNNDFNFSKLSK
jgi:hypothetical protein